MDLANRLPAEFGLKEELLSGRVKVLTKTDRLARHDKEASKHTSRFYNWFSRQMVGNYENWVFAQPAKYRFLVSYKSAYDNLDSLMEMVWQTYVGGDLPLLWGPVYQWYCMGLGKSDAERLEIPSLPQGDFPRYLL